MKPLTVAIMAGGRSRRMGTDKAQIRVAGEPLLDRTIRIAVDACLPVFVVGRELPANRPTDGIPFILDCFHGIGPLGGLAAALEAASGPILALACDMPKLTAETLIWLAAQDRGLHGCAAEHAGFLEPLFSVYTPDVLPLLLSQVEAGDYSLQALIRHGNFHHSAMPQEIAAAVANINTPEDLAALSTVNTQQCRGSINDY